MTRRLNHGQAYILGSIAKHADRYRQAMTNLNRSVVEGLEYGVRRGVNIDAANKAHFAAQLVDELLDQAEEMFDLEVISGEELRQLTSIAMTPNKAGFRRRFNEGDEY